MSFSAMAQSAPLYGEGHRVPGYLATPEYHAGLAEALLIETSHNEIGFDHDSNIQTFSFVLSQLANSPRFNTLLSRVANAGYRVLYDPDMPQAGLVEPDAPILKLNSGRSGMRQKEPIIHEARHIEIALEILGYEARDQLEPNALMTFAKITEAECCATACAVLWEITDTATGRLSWRNLCREPQTGAFFQAYQAGMNKGDATDAHRAVYFAWAHHPWLKHYEGVAALHAYNLRQEAKGGTNQLPADFMDKLTAQLPRPISYQDLPACLYAPMGAMAQRISDGHSPEIFPRINNAQSRHMLAR